MKRSLFLLHLLLVLAIGAGFMVSLPGCGGCNSGSQAAAKKKKEDEEAAKKKKKKKKGAEKAKPNFDPIQVRMLPSNDRTAGNPSPKMHIKPGHWAALSETTKANNFDFVGDLATFAEAPLTNPPLPLEIENTSSRLAVWRPASLPKGQAKNFETLLFVPRRPTQSGTRYSIRSELRGLRGGGLQEPGNILPDALRDYQHVIVVLATNPAAYTNLDKLNAVRMPEVEANPDEALRYYHVVLPNAEKRVPLPSHSLAWTATAFVIWDDINPAVLTEEQQQAMLDWLHWGGQLIVSGPNSLDKLKGSFLHAYLPAEAAETLKLDQSAFDEINQVWSLSEQKKTNRLRSIKVIPDRPMVGVRFKRHVDAHDIAGTGGLAIERRLGAGRIVVTAFPLTDVRIKQWKNFDNFFNGALLRRPPRKFANNEWASLKFTWDEPHLTAMLTEPRLGSTVRFFSRDVGFAADDAQAPPPVVAVMPDVMPGGTMPPGMAGMGVGGFAYEPITETRLDTTGQHPAVDDWHFNGFIASPQTGVAAWNDQGAASNAARQALTEAAGIEIPRADFVFKVLAVYLAILVPLNWFIFWMLGRVEWAWAAAPVIAVIGAGAVIRLAQLDIGFARSRTEVAVLEVQSGYDRGHLTRYTALYTSLSSSYRLAFAESSALALPFAAPPGEVAQQQISAISDVAFRIDQEKSLSGVKVQSNSTGMVHSEQMFPLAGRLTVLGDDQKGWTVKNTSTLTLRDVGLLHETADGSLETAYLAELEPGKSSPLSFSPAKSDDKGNPIAWLPEWDKSPVMSATAAGTSERKASVRLTRLARLAAERLRLMPGDVRLIAWTDQALAGMEIAPLAPQNTTYTLVVAHAVRGKLPDVRPDTNVAEDYFEPPLDPEIEPETEQAKVEPAAAAEPETSAPAPNSQSPAPSPQPPAS